MRFFKYWANTFSGINVCDNFDPDMYVQIKKSRMPLVIFPFMRLVLQI